MTICSAHIYSFPLPMVGEETSHPTEVGLGQVTCFGQWSISRCNSSRDLKFAVGFDLTWFALVIYRENTSCSFNIGPRSRKLGADLNPFTAWSQAQAAPILKQNHPAEPSHHQPTFGQYQIHEQENEHHH